MNIMNIIKNLLIVVVSIHTSLFSVVNVVPGGTLTGNVTTAATSSQIGALITFPGGDLSHIDGLTNITARSTNTIVYVDGVKRFRGNGQRTTKALVLQLQNNRLEGDLSLTSDITFQDSTVTVTYAGSRRLDQNIKLNGGILFLEEDINFNDRRKIQGPGKVIGNGRRITFGSSDFTYDSNLYFDNASAISINSNMTLSGVWTFSGSRNRISGKGFALTFGVGGKIIIERGSTLIFDNIVVDGITTNNLYCKNNAGTLSLKEMTWLQSSNYTFSVGSLQIKDHVQMAGASTFVYRSPMSCTINRNSKLLLDSGYTFSYDVISRAKDRLNFTDASSILSLNLANFYISYPGLQLKKGTLIIENEGDFFIDQQTKGSPENGLIIGNDLSADDMIVYILSGGIMNIKSGQLVYKNITSSAFSLLNAYSQLRFESGTALSLNQSMNMGRGGLYLHNTSEFTIASGKEITGSVNFFN